MKNTLRIGILLLVAVVAAGAAWADFQQAMTYFKSGKFLEAAGEFQTLVDETPDYADGHFMLGICFMKIGKAADAEKAFLKALELNPDKFEYHYNLANSYQVRGMFDKTVGTLNNAEKLAPAPQKSAFYTLRGFAHAARKDWPEAIEDLEAAVRIKPDGPTQTQIGKAYFALGDNEKAVASLRKAVKLKPTAEAHKLMAESLLNLAAKAPGDAAKKSRYAEALTESNAFLKLEPRSIDARYLVGRSALGAGKYDDAIASFNDVLSRKSDHCNAMANMGKAYTAKADWANALASLENATACQPSMGLAWENMGFVLQKMASTGEQDPAKKKARYNEAIAAYTKAKGIKGSASIDSAIQTCKQNIDVIDHNVQMDAAALAQKRAEEAEAARIAEEERKREEWKQKQEDDD